jgi:hypothetical protein
MEAELRVIVADAVMEKGEDRPQTGADLLAAIRRRFEPYGFVDDLVLPERRPGRPPPTFED